MPIFGSTMAAMLVFLGVCMFAMAGPPQVKEAEEGEGNEGENIIIIITK
jgi:hypothetical protein